jgi:hypothetical protein
MCLWYGLFVFLFLLIFQPFHLADTPSGILVLSTAYGITTALVMVLLNVLLLPLLPRFFNEDRWTIGRELTWTMLNVLIIGIANTAVTIGAGLASLTWSSVFYFQLYTILVGIFPVTVSVLLKQAILQRRYEKKSEEINEQIRHTHHEPVASPVSSIITIPSDTAGENLELDLSDLCFVRSSDNYIEVYYLQGGKITKKLLRGTLRRLESVFEPYPQLYRCHKSYIVNLSKVTHVSGNAQGYKLTLSDIAEPIPVSRQNNQEVKDRLAAAP